MCGLWVSHSSEINFLPFISIYQFIQCWQLELCVLWYPWTQDKSWNSDLLISNQPQFSISCEVLLSLFFFPCHNYIMVTYFSKIFKCLKQSVLPENWLCHLVRNTSEKMALRSRKHGIEIKAHCPNDMVGFFSKDLHVTTTWDTSLKGAILVLAGSLSKAVLPDVLPNFLWLSCWPLPLTPINYFTLSQWLWTLKSRGGQISLGSILSYWVEQDKTIYSWLLLIR